VFQCPFVVTKIKGQVQLDQAIHLIQGVGKKGAAILEEGGDPIPVGVVLKERCQD
jgi:hypothetical protein